MKGYTPETELFDVKTEFSTKCTVDSKPLNPTDDPTKVCYSPGEYDNNFEGPQTMRFALAQSRNIPAVKTLYLAGIQDSIETATTMGITTLKDPNQYGLTLVLGGGEVSLIDLTSAYGVFANDGIRNPYRSVLRVEDSNGNVLEEATTSPVQVIPAQAARQISDILSDTSVRMDSLTPYTKPLGRQIAVKTGTTNDYRDVWIEGYTPNIAVGFWAGKNDNTPMEKKIAGVIITPVWGAFMAEINDYIPKETFKSPDPSPDGLKPVLSGVWQGGVSYEKDKISGKLATDLTPIDLRERVVFPDVHTILNWVNKDDPRGDVPKDPTQDSQFPYWEYGIRNWLKDWETKNPNFKEMSSSSMMIIPTEKDDIHTAENAPKLSITSPKPDETFTSNSKINIIVSSNGKYPLKKSDLYINNKYIYTNSNDPHILSFIPSDIDGITSNNTIRIVSYDIYLNQSEISTNISVNP